jgi:hypothetical protein
LRLRQCGNLIWRSPRSSNTIANSLIAQVSDSVGETLNIRKRRYYGYQTHPVLKSMGLGNGLMLPSGHTTSDIRMLPCHNQCDKCLN